MRTNQVCNRLDDHHIGWKKRTNHAIQRSESVSWNPKKIHSNESRNLLCEHLFSHEYNLCTHMSRLTHLCWPTKRIYVSPFFSLSAPKIHFAPHSTISSFYAWNSPSNFVAQRLGWDDSGFLTDTLVRVEVHRQPSVVFLDNDLSGLLDSLRAYATLWNCNNA